MEKFNIVKNKVYIKGITHMFSRLITPIEILQAFYLVILIITAYR